MGLPCAWVCMEKRKTGVKSGTGGILWALVAGVAFTAGCRGSSLRTGESEQIVSLSGTCSVHHVSLRTDRQLYRAGDKVLLTIENHLDDAISYLGGCSIYLCQRDENDWVCELKECHDETVALGSRRSVVMVFPGSSSGIRLKYRLDYATSEGDPCTAESNEFSVGQME